MIRILGGEDFEIRIVGLFMQEFKRKKTACKTQLETIEISAVSRDSVHAANAPCHLLHKRLT